MPAYTFVLTPGVSLPQENGYLVLSALSRRLPFLHDQGGIQIAPVRGTRRRDHSIRTDYKSRLHIRGITPEQAAQVSGTWVTALGGPLGILEYQEVPLRPSPYLASRLVIFEDIVDRDEFMQEMARVVPGAEIQIGRRRTLCLKGKRYLGYAVHLNGLTAEASVRVQREGIGKYTSMGCGVFYPGRAGR